MTVEMEADRVLGSAAVEVGTRRCPVRVSIVPWEKPLDAAKQGRSAVWRRTAWVAGRMLRQVSASIEV